MFFDSSIPLDKNRAIERLNFLIKKGKSFDIKVKTQKRSISQNRYLHLILNWFGIEFGYELTEVKQSIFKEHVNSETFYKGEKEGIVNLSRWRSTANLSTQELTIAIDRFRDFSAKQGCYLPEPNDMASINEMERQLSIKSSKQYL